MLLMISMMCMIPQAISLGGFRAKKAERNMILLHKQSSPAVIISLVGGQYVTDEAHSARPTQITLASTCQCIISTQINRCAKSFKFPCHCELGDHKVAKLKTGLGDDPAMQRPSWMQFSDAAGMVCVASTKHTAVQVSASPLSYHCLSTRLGNDFSNTGAILEAVPLLKVIRSRFLC